MTIWWQRRRRDSVTSNGTIIDRRPIWVNGLHWLALVDKIICLKAFVVKKKECHHVSTYSIVRVE